MIDSFFKYAQKRQNEEAMALIAEEGLNVEETKRYITTSLRHEYATEHGTDLNATLPKMSRSILSSAPKRSRSLSVSPPL